MSATPVRMCSLACFGGVRSAEGERADRWEIRKRGLPSSLLPPSLPRTCLAYSSKLARAQSQVGQVSQWHGRRPRLPTRSARAENSSWRSSCLLSISVSTTRPARIAKKQGQLKTRMKTVKQATPIMAHISHNFSLERQYFWLKDEQEEGWQGWQTEKWRQLSWIDQ